MSTSQLSPKDEWRNLIIGGSVFLAAWYDL
jgi:hypothetical protein